MPYPNFHAARLIDPDKFEERSLHTIELGEGTGITAIVGRMKGEETTTRQAIRFVQEKFTPAQANEWLKEHDIEVLEFTEATGEDHGDAEWTAKRVNDLPDTAFLFVESGGEKDEDGKTVPRSLRHFPFRNEKGEVDRPHLTNAIARLPQAKIEGLSEKDVKQLQEKARALLREIKEERGEDGGRTDGLSRQVQRVDVAPLLHSHRTSEGYLLAEGYAGRAGVLEYKRADGSVQRELIPPEELFRSDSLGTLGRKPVTLGHPTKDGKAVNVDASNVQEYGVGDVDGEIAEEQGGFVRVRVAIRRADAVAAVESGMARGLSQGYTCDLDEVSGEWNGQRYDAVQRNRRYNHLALCGLGRAGQEVRLRVDDADVTIDGPKWPEKRRRIMSERTASIEIGGVRYDGLDPALASAIGKEKETIEAARADAATNKAQSDALKRQMDELRAGYDAKMAELQRQHEELQGKLREGEEKRAEMEAEASTHGDDFKARFDARVRLLALAGRFGVEKADDLEDGDLCRAVVAKHNPEMKLDSASDDYMTTYVRVLSDQLARADASQAVTAGVAAGMTGGTPAQPSGGEKERRDALAEYMKNTYGVIG